MLKGVPFLFTFLYNNNWILERDFSGLYYEDEVFIFYRGFGNFDYRDTTTFCGERQFIEKAEYTETETQINEENERKEWREIYIPIRKTPGIIPNLSHRCYRSLLGSYSPSCESSGPKGKRRKKKTSRKKLNSVVFPSPSLISTLLFSALESARSVPPSGSCVVTSCSGHNQPVVTNQQHHRHHSLPSHPIKPKHYHLEEKDSTGFSTTVLLRLAFAMVIPGGKEQGGSAMTPQTLRS